MNQLPRVFHPIYAPVPFYSFYSLFVLVIVVREQPSIARI